VIHNESLFEWAERQKKEEEERARTAEESKVPTEPGRKRISTAEEAERRSIIEEIRAKRRALRSQKMNTEIEAQVMAYDMQEALLANDAEEDHATP